MSMHCNKCGGSGEVFAGLGFAGTPTMEACPDCEGTGLDSGVLEKLAEMTTTLNGLTITLGEFSDAPSVLGVLAEVIAALNRLATALEKGNKDVR